MKKLLFLFTLAFAVSVSSFSQNSKVVSAYNYLRNGQLDKAKENIDLAVKHEKTIGQARTWFYMGNIYLAIHLSENAAYKSLDPDALQKAHDAYQKAISIDPNIYNEHLSIRVPMQGLLICGEQFYNQGVDLYNQKKYAEGMMAFEQAIKINQSLGKVDTLATYNAALCAELADMTDKAKSYYKHLIKLNFKQPGIYLSLSGIYKNEGDTAMALDVIQKGRKAFPDDYNMIIAETNLYLLKGDYAKSMELLDIAVKKDSGNPTLYYAIGTNYFDMLKNMDYDSDPAEFNRVFKIADANLSKAIELKPDYFEALYNHGALFVNEGVRVFEAADKISDLKLYAKEKEKYDALWTKAIVSLEAARELKPDDKDTLENLKQLYARFSMNDKLQEVVNKLKELEEK